MATVTIWVIMILTPGSSNPGVTVGHVYGFTTYEQCQRYADNKRENLQKFYPGFEPVCVATEVLPAGVLK